MKRLPGGARLVVFRLLSAILGTLAALLLGELAFRVMGIKPEEAPKVSRISNGPAFPFPGRAGHTVIDLYTSNPRGTFPIDLTDEATRQQLIRENFSRVDEVRATNPFGIAFDFNAQGYRDREFVPKPGGARRVVFIGDSFTEAQGVVEKNSAARLVEGLLRRREAGIETWNLGVRGRDFPDLEASMDAALELTPDAIILALVLNDVHRGPELSKRWPRVNDWIMVRGPAPSWLDQHSYFVRFVSQRYEAWRVSSDTTAWYRALYGEENREGWQRTQAALRRMQRRCEKRGVAFGVALWPLMVGLEAGGTYPFEAVHAEVRQVVERLGVPFLDLQPALRGRDPASLWVHSSDRHPNEKAQALVAPVLADFAYFRLLEPR